MPTRKQDSTHSNKNKQPLQHDSHSHIHSQEEYGKLINRISRIIGHTESIKTMMESQRDCTDILIQISAVQSALNSLGKLILKNHIDQCIVHATTNGKGPLEQQRDIDSLNEAIDKFIR